VTVLQIGASCTAMSWKKRKKKKTIEGRKVRRHDGKKKEKGNYRPMNDTGIQYPPISDALTRSLSPGMPAISKTLRHPPHILSAHQLQLQC
jgi:hypothetical protein